MPELLRLPLRAAELALAPTRFAVRTIWGLLHSPDEEVAERPAAAPPVEDRPRPEPPQTRPAPARKRAKPSPKAARRAVRHEPTKGEAAQIRQQARMEEQDAGSEGGPGATVTVAEPWEGYAAMSEEQILDRLTGADATIRGAVRLYEAFHENRRQIIYASEEPVAS